MVREKMMINISRLFLWLCLTFVVSNCQQLIPFATYQHEIAFPSITGQFDAASIREEQPIHHLSAGFHFNPPAPLPFLQSFPINPQLLAAARNSFGSGDLLFPSRGKFFGAPLNKLFTPNTVRQRPESEGQTEEYRKYLKEEAEDLEKEQFQNEITTDFADFSIDSTLSPLQPNQKAFVRVKLDGTDYSYTT